MIKISWPDLVLHFGKKWVLRERNVTNKSYKKHIVWLLVSAYF